MQITWLCQSEWVTSSKLFMVMCLCLCEMDFLYWNCFSKNISRILKTLCLISHPPGLQLFLFCWGGRCLMDQFHCLFIYSNIHWAPDVSTLVPGSGTSWWQSDAATALRAFSLVMLHGVHRLLTFQPVACLLFHHYFLKEPKLRNSLAGQFFPVIMPLRSSFHKKALLLSLQGISLPFSKIVFLTCDFCYLIQQKRLISWTCLSCCWDSPRWLFHFLAKLAWFLEL